MSSTASAGGVQKLSPQQDHEFAVWRALALQKAPYLASLIYRVTPLNAPGLATMGVDKSWRLYIDFDVVQGWGKEMCSQVLLHEAMHLMGRHSELGESLGVTDRMAKIFNAAADLSINDDLRDMGCSMIAKTGLLPARFGLGDYRTASEYYAELVKRLPKSPRPTPSQGQSGQGDSQTQDKGDGPGSGKKRPDSACAGGSGAGGPTAPWELDPAEDLSGDAPAVARAVQERVRSRVEEDMIQHARSRGTVPAGMLAEIAASKGTSDTPWDRILLRMLTRCLSLGMPGDQEVDYTRRSRRHHRSAVTVGEQHRRVFVPARSNPRVNVAVVRDTSGSMSATDIAAANREIMAIITRAGVEDDAVVMADVDAAVADTRTVRSAVDLKEVKGRGGTEMSVGIAWAQSLRPLPSAVIVITDGGTTWPSEKTRVPVVACVIGDAMTPQKARDGIFGKVPDWIHVVAVDTMALRHKQGA